MSDNVANYGAVRALPSFTAFPWLFAGPGALAILVALLAGFRGPFVPVRLRAHGTKRNLEARSSA
jgi:hypothetical protein